MILYITMPAPASYVKIRFLYIVAQSSNAIVTMFVIIYTPSIFDRIRAIQHR